MTYSPSHCSSAVLFAALLSSAGQAHAQEIDLQQCLKIPDIVERVACYDVLAKAQQARIQASAPDPERPRLLDPSSGGPAPPDPRREFGLSAAEREQERPQQPEQLDEIATVVASSRSVGAGYWQFTTAEGITWRLTEARRSVRPPRTGDEVKIRAGRLGSYYLEAGGQPSMRVVRVN